MKKKGQPPLCMLGRIVEHHSPAVLTNKPVYPFMDDAMAALDEPVEDKTKKKTGGMKMPGGDSKQAGQAGASGVETGQYYEAGGGMYM